MSLCTRFVVTFASAACTAATFSLAAQAADNTRYVSTTGSNSNACSLAAPCRTLQRGINKTPAGGELRILNSGNYGNNASVDKSMTIFGNGNTVWLSSPLTIGGGSLDHVVTLRGLVLNGQGAVTQGVLVNQAADVHIEKCVIQGFTQNGILVLADDVQVVVRNTISRNNGSAGYFIVNAGAPRSTIHNSHFANNGGPGVLIADGVASISHSTASGNGSGFEVSGQGTVTVEFSVASGNSGSGLRVNIGDVARISNSTFTGNGTGISNNSGTIETRRNNTVRGNTTDLSLNTPLTPIGGI